MFDRITVRMYEMGFGDCFLVTFWDGASGCSILFDCGSINRPKAEVAKVARDVIATCTSADGIARLALVVCTHRHKDHVSGFDDAIWSTVEVGEVWMPWTEHPTDPVATRIRVRQSSFAKTLVRALGADLAPDAMPLAAGATDERSAAQAMALNALTNEKAMATLHRGFAGGPRRRFLPLKGSSAQVRTIAQLPGVRFHILGPSRIESVGKAMDPPAGGAYLAMAGATTSPARAGACHARWRVDEQVFMSQRAARSTFTAKDKKAVDEMADEPHGDLAAAIDQAVNNTSLVLMIEAGDQFLLFPGDAQWGTWRAILEDRALAHLLESTTMLKVSHHGSHNGTPKELVETILRKGTVSLVSTSSVKQWPDVPRAPLMEALAAKTILARSDEQARLKRRKSFIAKDGYVEWETKVGRAP